VIVLVVALLGGVESRIHGVDDVGEGTESRPLVQTQSNAFLRGFDGTVLPDVRLVPLSEVHALVPRRHADVVSIAEMFSIICIFVAFHHRLNVFVDVVYALTKRCPSVTNTKTEGVSREAI